MIIERMRTNHIENPVGYLMERVSFSWIVTEAAGTHAVKARVRVALDEAMINVIHDSFEQTDIRSVDYAPELELQPETRYYWQVEVWDDAGDYGKSETAYFETAAQMK